MIIRRLVIDGWMPFANAFTLELDAGPIAIVGKHAGDERRSNRAGKSALLEATTWALYGEHRKRVDDAIINKQRDDVGVEVHFDSLVVVRKKKRGSSTKLTVWKGADSFVGDLAQEMVVEHLGLSYEDYNATNCFRQGDVDALIAMTAGDRLKLISEWLQQSRWLRAKQLQGAKVTRVETELATKRGELNAAKAQVLNDSLVSALRDDWTRCEKRVEELNAEIAALESTCREARNVDGRIQKRAELELLRKTARERKRTMLTLPAVEQLHAAATERHRLALYDSEVAETALADVRRLKEQGFDGFCPVMRYDCPCAQEVEDTLQEAVELVPERERVARDKAAIEDAAARELLSKEREMRAAQRAAGEYEALVDTGKKLSAQLEGFPDVEKPLDEVALNAELSGKKKILFEKVARLAEIKEMLAAAERGDERHKQLVNEIEATEEAAVASRLALKAIGAIPAKIAEEQISELELEANALLAGTGVSMRFSWQRELADKAPLCGECGFVYPSKRHDACPLCHAARGKKMADELEILCDDGSGLEEDVRFNSGGTRDIVGASIRLAASAMLRRVRSSVATWAIVDEPFRALDMENREGLARTFAGMLGSVGLEQALVVSHDPMLLSALPHRIVIDRDGGASTISYE